jgi:RHS repeat-associated protein
MATLFGLNSKVDPIEYNALNLPKKVAFAESGVSNEYIYSADGTKLSVVHKKASTEVRTDYVGNMIYKNDSLDMILVDGGYIRDGQYHFYFQDHLGSNRVVADAKGNVEQANHYYPYGTPFAESYSPDRQPRKYIGKEYDTENNLDWYDFEARFMDGTRFTTMDPLAEKYYSISPYTYCAGNPIRYVDANGREWKTKEDEETAKEMQREASKRQASLTKTIEKTQKDIETLKNNKKIDPNKKEKRLKELEVNLEDSQLQYNLLNTLNNGITQLGESQTVYTFNAMPSGSQMAVLSSAEDGTVIINHLGTIGNQAHETTHAIQYDNGEFTFDRMGGDVLRFKSIDQRNSAEARAYATEYSITNGTVPHSTGGEIRGTDDVATRRWLYGIKDVNNKYIYRPY